MLKKKFILSASIVLIISLLAMMISAAPLVKNVTSAQIGANEAENIALAKVGLTRENIRFERTEIDHERGKLVWEVEFEYENKEYSFEIDALTGKILREEIEPERRPISANTTQPPVTEPPVTNPPATEPPATQPPASEKPEVTEITRKEAINIALSEAGLTREQVRDLEVEKDYERGTLVYEVEFEHGRNEYNYEIRVSDGKVLTNSIEIDD
ncbi:MAG: PepSY domain-containing protein [Clostridia bacterium]|nr:PepSY domain-containing protein [Clostridia bacterium]